MFSGFPHIPTLIFWVLTISHSITKVLSTDNPDSFLIASTSLSCGKMHERCNSKNGLEIHNAKKKKNIYNFSIGKRCHCTLWIFQLFLRIFLLLMVIIFIIFEIYYMQNKWVFFDSPAIVFIFKNSQCHTNIT